ncbi:hypothetical protein D3C80_1490260 [compost metagenome]
MNKDQIPHVAGIVVRNDIFLFNRHQVRQQNIGIFRRRGHKVLNHHDHFALRIVLQNIVRFIDVRVLIGDGVTGIVPDELDRHVQFFLATHPITPGGHLRASYNGIGPAKAGDLRFDRVGQYRHTLNGNGIG